ncbi:hypothetical protein ACHAWF_003130 [Thalassiosira exigua]
MAPGILRLLQNETMPFYPYCEGGINERHYLNTKEDIDQTCPVITKEPLFKLQGECNFGESTGFTLFFFVDSTNRQSLLAIPLVSQWFHYTLQDCKDEGGMGSRIICIPNHPSPREISLHNSISDPILQATINSSTTSIARQQTSTMNGSGFYHLPFLHPRRASLVHILGVSRVPCVIVVRNSDGRIVTRYGWEAIERDGGKMKLWAQSELMEQKKKCDKDNDDESSSRFQSDVIKAWIEGKSGLPFWWHLLTWIL